jgi:hypothetical protein
MYDRLFEEKPLKTQDRKMTGERERERERERDRKSGTREFS